MKYYLHYKQKPYRLLGIARHSETLQDLVVYECLYENPSAKLWVRPQEMFFEDVLVNGVSRPRFEKVDLCLHHDDTLEDSMIQSLAPLFESSLGGWDEPYFRRRLIPGRKFHLVTARIQEQLVGFKLGYAEDAVEFYSWLGAVTPEFRRLGIATELMRTQHQWCREQGYRTVRTRSQNRFREMLALNLRHGFDVIGTHISDGGELKILLEKKFYSESEP